jgi:hypothetical protein
MTTSEAQVPAQEEPTILEKQETPERPFEFDLDELVASAKKSEEAQLEEDRQQYDANLERSLLLGNVWEKLVPESNARPMQPKHDC